MSKRIAIIGGGISGLSIAYWLYKANADVYVLEKGSEAGGSMESQADAGFLFDRGPNSGLETTPLLQEMVAGLDLQDEFIYASTTGNKRYILRDGILHPLPMSPPLFLKSKLFSAGAKLRLMAEPFVGRSKDGYYQSVAQFVERRLGREFLDYAINPFVSGVYAGRPEDLSVKSSFPKLYELEEEYGGLILGTIRSIRKRKKRAEKSKQSAKMFSFRSGMQTLPRAIAAKLKDRFIPLADVQEISKENNKYILSYNNAGAVKQFEADMIINTAPAFIASPLFRKFDATLSNHLDAVYYPPVLVVYTAFEKTAIKQPLDGFGFLIPEKEKRNFLGAIWSSVLFPGRSADGSASFTLFVGGARNSQIANEDREKVINTALREFREIMGIDELTDPVYLSHRFWSKAIPQYTIGYIEHERYFDEFEKRFPDIILAGNYRGGISVGDCIKNSKLTADKALSRLS